MVGNLPLAWHQRFRNPDVHRSLRSRPCRGGVVSSARNWSHFIGLIVNGSTIFVLYTTLYRFALIPRALAAFGLAAVLLQISAVARPLFGYDIVFVMLAPLGVSQLVLALWLIAKGFREPPTPKS